MSIHINYRQALEEDKSGTQEKKLALSRLAILQKDQGSLMSTWDHIEELFIEFCNAQTLPESFAKYHAYRFRVHTTWIAYSFMVKPLSGSQEDFDPLPAYEIHGCNTREQNEEMRKLEEATAARNEMALVPVSSRPDLVTATSSRPNPVIRRPGW